MSTTFPRKKAYLMFALAALALLMAIDGYTGMEEMHDGGNAVTYFF